MTGALHVTADAIRLEAVSHRFGAKLALDAVDACVPRGCITALCGPNGAGKSTLIRIVCGLLRPSAGHGAVLGEALDARPTRRRARIGYMAQHTVLYDELSVTENLAFRAGAMGLRDASARSRDALAVHGLASVAGSRVGSLSGGWRQRVAFAVAQLARPDLLLLDEPTAGLDADARADLWRALRELARLGTTVLVSTHDAAEAACCDHLLVLAQGRVTLDGSPEAHWSVDQLHALRVAAAIGTQAA